MMNQARYDERNKAKQRQGHTLVLLAIMLGLLVGMIGLAVDGGLLLAAHERAQNVADSTARSLAIALHNGATSESLQGTGEQFAFTHNLLPADPGMTPAQQLIVNHPPESGAYAGNTDYVEVLVTHPMDTNFIHVLGNDRHRLVSARAVAGFRQMPRDAGLVILNPRANPGLAVSGTNAMLDVDSGIVVYTRREGENQFGATVGEYHAGQPSVTVDGSGATMLATEFYVSGGVDDRENYVAPNVSVLHAGTNDPVNDPLHDGTVQLPIPTVANGVLHRDLGSVSISNNNVSPLVSPNEHNEATGKTTLYPGIYHDINISGGEVVLMPGIYVLQKLSGGGNILSITGGIVTGEGVMFYNTGPTWDPVSGGDDVGDLNADSETDPFGVHGTKFGGIDIHAEGVRLSPIDTDPLLGYDYSGMGGIEAFNQLVIYQRRFNTTSINITNGQPAPLGITGRFYAKWAELNLSGQGTYNFSIIVGSMSVSGRAIVTVRDRLPLEPFVEPVRLVE